MFASVGSVLKLHSWADNQLKQISTYTLKRCHPHDTKILNLSWCHDNSYIALLPEDNPPQIISSKDKININLVHTINAFKDVTAVTFKNHTKRNIAIANKNGDVSIYDTKNRSISNKIGSFPGAIKLLEYNCRDDQLAVLYDDKLSIFFQNNGRSDFVKEIQQPGVSKIVKYHPSVDNLLAVGGESGCVTLWDTEKEERLICYQKHSASVTGIAFTHNQKLMVSTGMDNKICIFDNSAADCLFRINLHQAVTAVDISPNDQHIAIGLEDGCIYIYDIRDPLKHLVYAKAHNCAVNKIAFEKGPVLVESLHDGHSVTTINDSDLGESSKFEVLNDAPNFEDNLRTELTKMVKTHMTYLESQLMEHCSKFQSFINREFDSIHNAMARWDVFNVGDTTEIVHAIDSNDIKSIKSSSRKSTNY